MISGIELGLGSRDFKGSVEGRPTVDDIYKSCMTLYTKTRGIM